jgi:hypothetical protein
MYDCGLVFTSDYGRAFDFPLHILYPNAINLTEELQRKIIELNLDSQTATKIQNEFANYIVETLNKY